MSRRFVCVGCLGGCTFGCVEVLIGLDWDGYFVELCLRFGSIGDLVQLGRAGLEIWWDWDGLSQSALMVWLDWILGWAGLGWN